MSPVRVSLCMPLYRKRVLCQRSSNSLVSSTLSRVNRLYSSRNPLHDDSSSSSSSSALIPTQIGFGEDAPRYPHILALPVISRPLFPGIVTTIQLTDETTIRALERLMVQPSDRIQKSAGTNPSAFAGVFLRKKNNSPSVGDSTSSSNLGLIDTHPPELITDPLDLYTVGTFAQIHRITRGNISTGDVSQSLTQAMSQEEGQNSHEETQSHDHMDHTSTDQKTSSASLLLLAHRRIDLLSVDSIGPPIHCTVKHWDRLKYTNTSTTAEDTIRALSNEVLSIIREVATINPLFREHVTFFPSRIDPKDPYRLADFAASLTTGSPDELQGVLEERDAELRLHKALVLLSKEREVSKLQQEISRKVEEKMTETQRRYFLMEQLKSIKKELGMEKDDKEALLIKYRKKMSELESWIQKIKNEASLTNQTDSNYVEVLQTMESEIEKIGTLEKNSAEFNMTRSYLDWLTSLPWGHASTERLDIHDARMILDRDHYGLDEVKDTILQFIAVGKLKGSIQGKILCLAGPPGVGKTSIAESIAEALGRKFYRFSVGGLSDVSEIKGHRRTYIGAMPGKIIQCLKTVGTENPLVLIDEIDKLGRGYRGDPASALLEVLDPSQNSGFRDYYLDVPIDISKVLFMCTANDIENIPGPLLDRMEVIRLSGYDVPEKVAIAEQYLVPKAMRENGLMLPRKTGSHDRIPSEDDRVSKTQDNEANILREGIPQSLSIERSALESLVRWYCREAGVRNLNKYIEQITRKLALQIVAEGENALLTKKSARKSDTWIVSDTNLHEYVGKQIFTNDRMYDKDPLPHGIVMGLAWTSMGGSALYIETQAIKRGVDKDGKRKGGGMLKVTGQLGKVMEESTQIASTVARQKLGEIDPSNAFFDEIDIHLHVPEGATPKDGPSAGITIVTALLSLAMDRPVLNDLAMSGEISLTGKVLPVGGIREKTMAARRAGIKRIILPLANKRDFDEMPDYLKDNLEPQFVEEYDDVFNVAFANRT